MKSFGDLKVGDRFYCVRDLNITVYNITDIVDHGSYITVSGSDIESVNPDRGFNVSKNLLNSSVKECLVHKYFSDWRAVKVALSDIIYAHESAINVIKDKLSQLMFTVDESEQ